MDKCALCGGNLVKRRVKVDRWKEDELLVFESVEVEVCTSCGETWVSSRAAETMDKVLQGLIKPTKNISVPVWDLKKSESKFATVVS